MKTYVITVSEKFPSNHPRKGEPTNFVDQIFMGKKIHTIRGNYELWAKRIAQVEAGEAMLSLRTWEGRPYFSKQIEFLRLWKVHGVGIEKVQFSGAIFTSIAATDFVAQNDGLSFEDFRAWFKGYDLSKPMAIIHFKNFRYG